MNEKNSILAKWDITEAELTTLVEKNPSLRGMLLGYIAEKKFYDLFLKHPNITAIHKDDDHNRAIKGDKRLTYRGHTFLVEVKSLQTNLVKKSGVDTWTGKVQVDASDNRTVTFPDGSQLKTTCLLRGEFDILAVNSFAYGEKWRFAFALNSELPENSFHKYTVYQRQHLLPTLITLDWPLKPPFTDNFHELLDKLVLNREIG